LIACGLIHYAARMHPDLIRQFQRAVQLQQQGQLDAAAKVCEALLRQVPDEPDPLHLFGLIRKQQGRFEDAERLLRASIEHAPERAVFFGNFGNLLAQMQRHADAEQAYRQALALDPHFRAARLGLARLLNDAGVHAAAEQETARLLQANANDAEAWATSAAALAGLSRLADAEAAYRNALRIAPGYGAAHHNLGALLAKAERIEESLQAFEQAAAAGVAGVEIDVNRATALMKLYRFDEGEQILINCVQRAPGYAPAQELLAKFRFMRGDERFAHSLAAAVREQPANAALQLAYAQVLHGAHLVDEAREALLSALQHLPADPHLLATLASVHQEAGEFAEALASARAAVKAAPADPAFADYVIDALMSLGRADEALPLIRAGRERQPAQQWYIAIEATAARLLGDPLYEELCDYERMLQCFDLAAPNGWRSLQDFHADLLTVLQGRHRFQAHPLDRSLRFGTQTPRNLLGDPDPVIQAFIRAVFEPIDEYRASLGHDPGHPLRGRNHGATQLSGCWSVRLQRGGFHVNHIHSAGWISSAYYVDVPEETEDPLLQSGWIKFGEPRYPVPGATVERTVQPLPGRLVLFPSYFWHGTTPLRHDTPRMTLAFDAVTARDELA
jgi:tetratricopeptide (TPR) repeat protein